MADATLKLHVILNTGIITNKCLHILSENVTDSVFTVSACGFVPPRNRHLMEIIHVAILAL